MGLCCCCCCIVFSSLLSLIRLTPFEIVSYVGVFDVVMICLLLLSLVVYTVSNASVSIVFHSESVNLGSCGSCL